MCISLLSYKYLMSPQLSYFITVIIFSRLILENNIKKNLKDYGLKVKD